LGLPCRSLLRPFDQGRKVATMWLAAAAPVLAFALAPQVPLSSAHRG
jgi:hypothetical protein